jgi:hypothetical protein
MMRRALLLAAIAAGLAPAIALAPSGAQAHGPTRQKTSATVTIDAPAAKVWAVVGNFQDMGWHPAVAKTEGTGGTAVGATRALVLASGGRIEEALTKYNAEARSLSYEITAVDVKVLPVANYSSTISVKEDGGKAIVEWRGAFYRGYMNNDPPPGLDDEAAIKAVDALYKAGLDALKKKVESGS